MLKISPEKQYMRMVREQVIDACQVIRKDHKRIRICRKMYVMAQDSIRLGERYCRQIGFDSGFKVKIKRNTIKTTWSQRVEVYPNLLEGSNH
ncbi:MAG: hypothetical protein U0X76_04800 [Bacteroidia bacterium]